MELELTRLPDVPEFNNSAGRLLELLRMFRPATGGPMPSHYDAIYSFYTISNEQMTDELKSLAYIQFMSLVGRAFDEFVSDVEKSEGLTIAARKLITVGVVSLKSIVYSVNPQDSPAALTDDHVMTLEMAGSLMAIEEDVTQDDEQQIRDSIEGLRKILDDSDISKSARVALLELMRLSRNALDQYSIHGARGFKEAFKKMLAELMEVYLHEGQEVTKQPWWKSAMDHARCFDAVAARLSKYTPLLKTGAKLLFGEWESDPPA